MLAHGQKLLEFGAAAVLIKGGHASGPATSISGRDRGSTRFTAPRVRTENTHGTGCSFASAIAAGLAKGFLLAQAVGEAKTFVSAAIAAADRLEMESGRGPLHHFFKWW